MSGLLSVVDQHVSVDPVLVHPDELGGLIAETSTAIRRLQAYRTRLLATFEDREAYRADGSSNARDWLRDNLNESRRTAGRDVKTAQRLQATSDDTQDAFAAGDIDSDAVDVIAAALDDDGLAQVDGAEGRLLEAARAGGADAARAVGRQLAAGADHDAAADRAHRQHRDRRLWRGWRDDGMYELNALLDPANGEAVDTALNALIRPDGPDTPPQARRTPAQRAADALAQLARTAIATGQVPDSGGRRTQVLVTTPLDTLRRDLDATTPARLLNAGPISADTARRLACDAAIVPVVLNGRSVPIDLGRATRTPTDAQRRCLLLRDRGCRLCAAPAQTCIPHHCIHWVDAGPTDLDNLVLLCWNCHELVHEGRWNLRWHDDNTITFTTPDGRTHIRPPPT